MFTFLCTTTEARQLHLSQIDTLDIDISDLFESDDWIIQIDTTKSKTNIIPDTTVVPENIKIDTTIAPKNSNIDSTIVPKTIKVDTTVVPEINNIDTTVVPEINNIDTTVVPEINNIDTTVVPEINSITEIDTTVVPVKKEIEVGYDDIDWDLDWDFYKTPEDSIETIDSFATIENQKPVADDILDYIQFAEWEEEGDRLMKEYEFEKALYTYKKITAQDTAYSVRLENKILNATNALSLLNFTSRPVVVSKQKFSVEDFFLFYPLEDGSWRNIPNSLDNPQEVSPVKATYFPVGSENIYFSAEDKDGVRNIYFSENQGNIWSYPTIMNEHITSESNEIYPMLSPDGNKMYFASDGLYGIGGYDIFVSEWNEATGDWGTPANLGFPYSSPYDDFLFMNTEDGKYSIFASNRECQKDSVYIYILENDAMPVRSAMSQGEVKELSVLNPVNDDSKMDITSATGNEMEENDEIAKYMHKMENIRVLRDTINAYSNSIDERRNRYAASNDADERLMLSREILIMEDKLPALQDSLDIETVKIHQIEMDFLFRGVVIDPSTIVREADKEVVGAKTNYTFIKQNLGRPLTLTIEEPEVKFDYSFQILESARMAEDQNIPDGLVYQIQILSQDMPVKNWQLKGLSPVYLYQPYSSKYIYRVGLFNTYDDVMSNLNKVKRLGFRSSFTVAFYNGKQISLSEARKMEKTIDSQQWQVMLTLNEDMETAEANHIVKSLTNKKIAMMNSSGKIIFVIGPFNSDEEAAKFMQLAEAAGFEESEMSKI